MNKEVIAFMHEALENGQAVALAVLTQSGEGTPGVPGGMMAVAADGTQAGTVGGGAAEGKLVQESLQALRQPESTGFTFAYDLHEDGGMGMVCGGDIAGYVTIVRAGGRLCIFGGGHVGQRVCQVGLAAGFDVTVVDDRAQMQEKLPGAQVMITDNFAAAAQDMPLHEQTYVVIVTRGHRYDLDVLRACLQKDCAYIGMIGSRKKVRGLFEKLEAEGVGKETLNQIYTPVGLDIDDGSPGEIAVAIVAEILAVKNGGALRHCKEKQIL